MHDPKNLNAIFERPVENQHWSKSVDAKDSQCFHGTQAEARCPAELGMSYEKLESFMRRMYELFR